MIKFLKSISFLVLSALLVIGFSSCKKKKTVENIELGENKALAQTDSENGYIESCPKNFEFIIACDSITVDNMYDHVIVLDCYNEMRVLGIRQGKAGYIISSKEEYIPGEVYTIIVADDTRVLGYIEKEEKLVNDGKGYDSKQINFGIIKEETRVIEYDYSNLKVLKESNIIEYNDNYVIITSGNYEIGNIIAITDENKEIKDDSLFIKVTNIESIGDNSKITYELPQVEEIYKELDIYTEQEFNYDEIDLDAVDHEKVIQSIKDSDTYEKFLCAASVVNPGASKAALSGEIKVDFKLAKSDKGVSAEIKLSYSYKGFTIQLIFEPTLRLDLKASAKLDLHFLIWKSKLNFDFALTTNLEMPITLKLMYDYKMSDKLKASITDALTTRDEDATDILNTGKDNEVKGNEIVIDIFESPQYQIPYTPLGVSLDVDFVIDLQIHAELSAKVIYKNKTTVGVKTTSSGLQNYKSEEKQLIFDDVVIQGKIDATAGLRLSGKLGLLCLQKYVNVSLSFDVGAYVTIAGKIVFESKDGTISGYELSDAVYCVEAGIYFRLSFGYKLFSLSDRFTLAELRLPIFHVGNELRETKLEGKTSLDLKTKLTGIAAVVSKLGIKVKTVNILTEEITYPIPDIDEISVEFASGEHIKYVNGCFRVDLDEDHCEDDVIIKYKNDPELTLKVHINYINEAALDGLYNDESNAIYELDRETHTYTLVSVPTNVEVYSVVDKITGFPVVGIQDNAFYNCKKLTNVYIPSTVKTIGNQAFYGCENLKDIDLSDVTTLGEAVFRNCKSLDNVVLPSSLTKIPEYTFYGCKSLKNINLDNIIEFESNSFNDCDSLVSIKLNNVTTFDGSSFANCDNLLCINTNNYELILNDSPFFCANSSLCIAVNKNAISSYQDKYINLKNKFVDDSLIFDEYILEECSDGYSVRTYIGNSSDVVVPSSIDGHTITTIGSNAFGKSLKTLTLPETISTISSKACYNCENLTRVNILNKESVVVVGTAAFWGTNSKLLISVPNSVVYALYKTNTQWTMYYDQLTFGN